MHAPQRTNERQFSIWRSRVYREIEKSADAEALCPGASLYEAYVDEQSGVATARFHVFVPFRDGSSALRMIPLTALEISMPFAHEHGAQFPFCAPRVVIYQGAEYLPREMRHFDHDTRESLAEIPMLTHWSPSNTLVMVLQDFVAVVQQNDPQTAATTTADGGAGGHAVGTATRAAKRLRMRKRDIYGAIYHCQEVDSRTGTLRPVPMLLQSGNIVLLVPPSKATAAAQRSGRATADADADHIYVSDLFPLKDISRITPQRGKSITFFFKDPRTHCRTLLTSQTEAIIADFQRMIAAVGSKRARDEDEGRNGRSTQRQAATPAQDDGAFSQLLSFLTPEQTEKAKEVSSKIVGKISRWGSTVSRFFKGDDTDEYDTTTPRPGSHPDPAFEQVDRLKTQFFQHPSKPKMLEITNRYQQMAEQFAQRNARDGLVEKAIEQMQSFIEHPTTQKLLLEAYAIESSDRGIRVGSL